MVIYDLKCVAGHKFEAWFKNAEEYDRQVHQQLIQCSICGAMEVAKVPSGGHLGFSKVSSSETTSASSLPESPESTVTAVSMDPVTLMKAVTHFVKSHCKDVGDKFAETAFEIHRGEKEVEPIFGTVTEEEREALDDEGVSFSLIPKLSEEFDN